MTMHLETLNLQLESSVGTVNGWHTRKWLGQYEAYLAVAEKGIQDPAVHPIDLYSPLIDTAKQVVENVYKPSADNEDALAEIGRYGETIIASEALSSMGVRGLKHYIYWANGRAGLAVPVPYTSDKRGEPGLYLFSTDIGLEQGSSPLAQKRAPNLAESLIGTTVSEATTELAKADRAVTTVDASDLPRQTSLKSMRFQPTILSLFPATQGRQALIGYSHFLSSVRTHQPEVAQQHLERTQHIWPRADARGSHRTITQLVGQLCTQDPKKAQETADMYCDTFPASADVTRLRAKLHKQTQRAKVTSLHSLSNEPIAA